MGFLDYAWSSSLQKDDLNTAILVDPTLRYPTLSRNNSGFTITLPIPSIYADADEESISFLGFKFQSDSGKEKVGRLFRASVVHLTAHTLMPTSEDRKEVTASKQELIEAFSESLVNDAWVKTFVSTSCPDKLPDLAFANALSFAKMKPVERIFNPATRIMTALLTKQNIDVVKGILLSEEETVVSQLTQKLRHLEKRMKASLVEDRAEFDEFRTETMITIMQTLESHGPILEAPSLHYTEQIGPCTVFSEFSDSLAFDTDFEMSFKRSFEILGGKIPSEGTIESFWTKEKNLEAQQIFNSWQNQKQREQKILTRFEKYIEGTRLRSVEFPEENYAKYLKTRTFLKGGSRRLLDSLRIAKDALDEDPRKEMGQLDLTEVIQKLSSSSPRTDVFMQNEYLSSSFAWAILFDSSASMRIRDTKSRALAICVAEATKELLMDPGSWTLLAFSDSLQILKDSSEAYSRKVRARIGGLKFNGLTYMPDAMRAAGKILTQRFDEQRFLVVLSDGWPYGYKNIEKALSDTIDSLRKKDIIVIGVGLQSEKMKEFFKINCAVYNQRDLVKNFAKIYMKASGAALEK
ncbi:MAG: hypothetical protein NWF11_01160 [Candidatus Bathyarchaeota archaeon]|nr:hypothetical protein [Candidatus Bathyarchaeota archaeon]